jgi:hypothetical protein
VRVNIADLALHIPDPPAFWVDELVPADVVTLLGAHGGTGKTTLALYAAVCMAMGLPFLGKACKPARVLFYSAEDDGALLRFRLANVCQKLGVNVVVLAERLTVIDASESDSVLFAETRRDGVTRGEATPAFSAMVREMAEAKAQIVILDNASDVFGGDEINRGQVRAFIRLLAALVKPVNGAVVLLAHVDKATARVGGKEGYSGSTAWHNSVRSRLFLAEDGDTGTLILDHQKSNRGKKADPMRLTWDAGMLALVEEPLGRLDVLLRLVDEYFHRGDFISPTGNARNSAYNVLGTDAAWPPGLTKGAARMLIDQAVRDGRAVIEEFRNTQRNPAKRIRVLADFCDLA